MAHNMHDLIFIDIPRAHGPRLYCSDHVNCAHEEVVYLDERSGSYVTCAACQKEVI